MSTIHGITYVVTVAATEGEQEIRILPMWQNVNCVKVLHKLSEASAMHTP